MEAADDLLAKYKKHPFAKGLLPFQFSMAGLGTPTSKIFAKQDGRQRWVISDKTTGLPALFSHAAVFAEADPMDTGNYVPVDETIPFGLDPKTIQRKPNTRCFYTYILDTFTDISLYEGQWTLDEYMSTVPGFNPRTLPRRAYLSGQDVRYRSRFWMQTPMFLRKGAQMDPSEGIGHLHPWVVDGDRQSKGFKGNPDKPRVWVKEGDKIVPISEIAPGGLQRGDVLALSFTVTYHITNSNWFPQFHPADVVVLRQGDGDITDYSAPSIELYSRPPPSFALEDDGDSSMEASGTQMVQQSVAQSGPGAVAMEDVVEGGAVWTMAPASVGAANAQEHMEVDESMVLGVGTVPLSLESTVGRVQVGGEAFEFVPPGGGEGEGDEDGFVDIAQQGASPAGRAGGGRLGRPARKRS